MVTEIKLDQLLKLKDLVKCNRTHSVHSALVSCTTRADILSKKSFVFKYVCITPNIFKL